jgi:hypothetical protein
VYESRLQIRKWLNCGRTDQRYAAFAEVNFDDAAENDPSASQSESDASCNEHWPGVGCPSSLEVEQLTAVSNACAGLGVSRADQLSVRHEACPSYGRCKPVEQVGL